MQRLRGPVTETLGLCSVKRSAVTDDNWTEHRQSNKDIESITFCFSWFSWALNCRKIVFV